MLSRGCVVAFLWACLSWQVFGQDGGAGNGSWSSADNWNPDFVPATTADVLFDDIHVTLAQTIDVGTGVTRSLRSLQIDAPFSYTLNNGTLHFESDGMTGTAGISITQTKGVAGDGQIISSDLSLGEANSGPTDQSPS